MCHSPVAQFQLSTHRSPTAACVDKEHVSQAVVSLVQHRIVSSYYHFGFVGDVGDVGDVSRTISSVRCLCAGARLTPGRMPPARLGQGPAVVLGGTVFRAVVQIIF